ncbi:uncharacterized protein HaLaN_06268, partial [Haematococcus lacustris]
MVQVVAERGASEEDAVLAELAPGSELELGRPLLCIAVGTQGMVPVRALLSWTPVLAHATNCRARLGLHSSPEEFVDSLPTHVKRRVEALQALQEKHEELAGEFRKELALLEAKYERLYGPLYAERSEVVSGAKAVALKDGDKAEDKGIPEFWLTALLKCDVTAELIKDKDIDVLKYLKDITVLEKAYHMLPEDDGVLEKAEGTKIEWKA